MLIAADRNRQPDAIKTAYSEESEIAVLSYYLNNNGNIELDGSLLYTPIHGEIFLIAKEMKDRSGEINPTAVMQRVREKYPQKIETANKFIHEIVELNIISDREAEGHLQILKDKRQRREMINQGEKLKNEGARIIKDALDANFEIQPTNGRLIEKLETWEEIKKQDVRVEYTVDCNIVKDAVNVVFGMGGIGKTYLLLDMARCIGQGIAWQGFKTIQSPVIFIDFENSLAVLNERINKLGDAQNVHFWRNGNEKIKLPKLDSKQEWLQYKNLPTNAVLIFDTLRAAQGGDENASKDMGLIMNRLKELRDSGFTVVVLHHTAKNSDSVAKGSTAIVDGADHVLGLVRVKKKKDGKDVVIDEDDDDTDAIYRFGHGGKTRYKPHRIYLTFNPDCGFVIAPDPEELALQDMFVILEAHGSLCKTEFIERCHSLDIAKNRARTLINRGAGRYWDIEYVKSHNSQRITPKKQLSTCPPL